MKKGYTHVAILIDRSGSMSSIKQDVIGGFNQLIADQKKVPGELTVTLVQFDDNAGMQYDTVNDFANLSNVKLLTEETYVPRGSTPLNDALARLINETGQRLSKLGDEQRPENILLVVMTDGYENASKEHTKQSVKDLITHQEQKYNWKFLYIGANQDSFAESASRGMGSTMNFAASKVGTAAAYNASSQTLTNLRSSNKMYSNKEIETLYDQAVKAEETKDSTDSNEQK